MLQHPLLYRRYDNTQVTNTHVVIFQYSYMLHHFNMLFKLKHKIVCAYLYLLIKRIYISHGIATKKKTIERNEVQNRKFSKIADADDYLETRFNKARHKINIERVI